MHNELREWINEYEQMKKEYERQPFVLTEWDKLWLKGMRISWNSLEEISSHIH